MSKKAESRTKNLEELEVEAPPEGKARIPWQIPPMPPGYEPDVEVVTLIGRSSGTVVKMPKSAAQAALAMGTAQRAPGVTYGADMPGVALPETPKKPLAAAPVDLTGTVAEVSDAIAKVETVEDLDAIEEAETGKGGKDRKGVLEAIEKRRAELLDDETEE